jgi:hypothetical protein
LATEFAGLDEAEATLLVIWDDLFDCNREFTGNNSVKDKFNLNT